MAETTQSQNQFLYDKILRKIGEDNLEEITLPQEMIQNLNQRFDLREYQKKAFQISLAYFERFKERQYPAQLLYNMATGSGKTLIMAGLILYLYKKGYNNFLFFVNSKNIINKTKNNFLDQNHSKYLFNQKILFEGKEIRIREVNDFVGTNKNEINICFTTIQKLHDDLNIDKENSLTLEYFKDKKIVLLSDEAHHGQANTKQKTLEVERTWENTVKNILEKNRENILLEFTATMGIEENQEIKEKYTDKLIYKYDLIDFRNDGFSKEPEIFRVDEDKKYRMLTAVLINQYRQDIAQKYASLFKDSENLTNFKPVILFKATKEIKESLNNQEYFNEIIDKLKKKDLEDIKKRIGHPIIKKIFDFYEKEKISLENLIEHKIKINFSKKHCLNVNEENLDKRNVKQEDAEEVIEQQDLLNSLEDKDNKIRVIFAVQKLNEGWDVLNLYDIVRISDKQASGGATIGGVAKTTISEAQLVGRGVRYFPFKLDPTQKPNLRKYDSDIEHDLRVLEELYFHCHPGDKGRYIAELKKAFEREGLGETGLEEKELKIKDSFKKSTFYKNAKIYVNKPILKDTSKINSFSDLGYKEKDMVYEIYSGKGDISKALGDEKYDNSSIIKKPKTIQISDIEPHIIKNAISKVFQFGNDKIGIKKYLPNLDSINDLILKSGFLKEIKIDFLIAEKEREISNKEKLDALVTLLKNINEVMRGNYSRYRGTKEFFAKKAFGEKEKGSIFFDKTIRVKKGSERSKGEIEYLQDKDWYVFNANYGTDQEKFCVRFIEKLIEQKKFEDYKELYLVRNEMHFKIYDFEDGQAFAPDFVLFMKSKNKEEISYQIFIEPKGPQFKGNDGQFETGKDGWKQKFLKKIKESAKIQDLTKYENKDFRLIGVRFYNQDEENLFEENLLEQI